MKKRKRQNEGCENKTKTHKQAKLVSLEDPVLCVSQIPAFTNVKKLILLYQTKFDSIITLFFPVVLTKLIKQYLGTEGKLQFLQHCPSYLQPSCRRFLFDFAKWYLQAPTCSLHQLLVIGQKHLNPEICRVEPCPYHSYFGEPCPYHLHFSYKKNSCRSCRQSFAAFPPFFIKIKTANLWVQVNDLTFNFETYTESKIPTQLLCNRADWAFEKHGDFLFMKDQARNLQVQSISFSELLLKVLGLDFVRIGTSVDLC